MTTCQDHHFPTPERRYLLDILSNISTIDAKASRWSEIVDHAPSEFYLVKTPRGYPHEVAGSPLRTVGFSNVTKISKYRSTIERLDV